MEKTIESRAFVLMGRLHVIVRREINHIIDIEYMRIDPDYCNYVLDLTAGTTNEELLALSDKVRELFFGPGGLFVEKRFKPLFSRDEPTASRHPPPSTEVVKPAHPTLPVEPVADKAYVGRLR